MDSVSESVEAISPEALAETRSIGRYLAGQRELRGISVEELATQTRIPLRSLQRLETGVFDGDIDGFVRGFVRTVAEALGLDPEDTLTRMLVEPDGSERRTVRSYLSVRRVLLAAGLVIVGCGKKPEPVEKDGAGTKDAASGGWTLEKVKDIQKMGLRVLSIKF